MTLLKFASRNTLRNKKRSLLIIFSLSTVTSLMIVWGSLASGFAKTLERIATGSDLGNIQVHHSNYLRSKSIYDVINDQTYETFVSEHKDLKVAPRSYSSALIAAGPHSTYAQIRAVDPIAENIASDLFKNIKSGVSLTSSSSKEVMLGIYLAKRLGVGIGEKVVLLGTAVDGSYANDLATVVGIFQPLNPTFDKNGVVMGIGFFRELYAMESGYHELAVFTSTETQESALQKVRLSFNAYSVSTWEQLRPILAKTIRFLGFAAWFTYIYAYIALCGLLLNIFLMNIYDRMRDYGILRAIGFYNSEIVRLIYFESFFLTLVSCFIAVIVGSGFSIYLSQNGLDFSFITESLTISGLSLRPVLYANPTFWTILGPTSLVMILVPLVAFLPAREAAKKNILEALYHV